MKVIELPLYHTFTIWIATVFFGSILLPFTVTHADITPEIIAICMAFSAVCSIPSLLVLLLVHYLMNRKKLSLKKHQLLQNLTHLVVSTITFLVIPLDSDDSLRDIFFSSMIVYPLIAFTLWNLVYRSFRTKQAARNTSMSY